MLEALAAGKKAATLECVLGVGVQHPVALLPRQQASQEILRKHSFSIKLQQLLFCCFAGVVVVEGEKLHNEPVDAAQCKAAHAPTQ